MANTKTHFLDYNGDVLCNPSTVYYCDLKTTKEMKKVDCKNCQKMDGFYKTNKRLTKDGA